MGVDARVVLEVKNLETQKWEQTTLSGGSLPFDWRSYSIYGFLAGVRTWSGQETLKEPCGFPDDSEYLNSIAYEDWGYGGTSPVTVKVDWEESDYSCTTIYLSELLAFDYDKTFEDVRGVQVSPTYYNGSAQKEPGQGDVVTYRKFLGETFMSQLEEMKQLGKPENVRVLMGFS